MVAEPRYLTNRAVFQVHKQAWNSEAVAIRTEQHETQVKHQKTLADAAKKSEERESAAQRALEQCAQQQADDADAARRALGEHAGGKLLDIDFHSNSPIQSVW
jgi:hypothetical protein